MKLRIEKAVYGGDGLARIPVDEIASGGKTVFVAGTLPGELVEASIATDRRSFSTGELDAILEPSPERVVPGCEYVPGCGGCQYQHASAAYPVADEARDSEGDSGTSACPGPGRDREL